MKILPWHLWTGAVIAVGAAAAKLSEMYYRFRGARDEAKRQRLGRMYGARVPYELSRDDVRRFFSLLQETPAELIRLRNALDVVRNTHLVFQMDAKDAWAMVPTASATLVRHGDRDLLYNGALSIGFVRRGGAVAACTPRDFDMAVAGCVETIRAAEEAEDIRIGCAARSITMTEFTKLPEAERATVRAEGHDLRHFASEVGSGSPKESQR